MRTALCWIVSLLVVALCIALPLLLPHTDAAAAMDTIGALLGAAASVVTMLLAFMLFRRFGTEQQMLERQLGAVTELLAELNKFSVWFQGTFDKRTIGVNFRGIDVRNRKSEEAAHPIKVTRALESKLRQIGDHSSNVFLPISIARSLGPIPIAGWSRPQEPTEEPMHWQVRAIDGTLADPNDEIVGFHLTFLGTGRRDGPLTLADLESRFAAVVDAIDAWHTKHAGPERMLNLAHHRWSKTPAP